MNQRSSLRRHTFVATALCTALLACNASRSQAASYTWTGAGPNGLWSTATNWAPSSGLPSGTTPHSVTYNNNVNTTGTVNAAFTLNSLDFTSLAGSFTINGDAANRFINMRGHITNSSTATQTINTQLRYPTGSGTGTFTIGGSGNILLSKEVRSGTGVTVNVVGTGTVTLSGQSLAFDGALTTTGSSNLEIANTVVVGNYLNNGSLFVKNNFVISGSMTLNNSGTVSFTVPADPLEVNTIVYNAGSSYGGTLNVNLSGTYANTGTSPTLVNPTSFQLFDAAHELATGGFTTVTGSYAGTNLVFTESMTEPGYWYSNAIGGGPQDGQYLTFDEETGMLLVVPEPPALVIAGVGVALAGWRMARRRKGGEPSA